MDIGLQYASLPLRQPLSTPPSKQALQSPHTIHNRTFQASVALRTAVQTTKITARVAQFAPKDLIILVNEPAAAITPEGSTYSVRQGSGGVGAALTGIFQNFANWATGHPDKPSHVLWVGGSKTCISTAKKHEKSAQDIDMESQCPGLANIHCKQMFGENVRGSLVFLSAKLKGKTYDQYDNNYLWPIYHNLMGYLPKDWCTKMTELRSKYEKFCWKFLVNSLRDGRYECPNPVYMINDYQLTGTARVARKTGFFNQSTFVYYHHIPFNLPRELVCKCKKDKNNLEKLLDEYTAYDWITFQTAANVQQFAKTVKNYFPQSILNNRTDHHPCLRIFWKNCIFCVSDAQAPATSKKAVRMSYDSNKIAINVLQTLLEDYLAYDRIGFQTKLDVQRFVYTLKYYFGEAIKIHRKAAKDIFEITWDNRKIQVSSFPIARSSADMQDETKLERVRKTALEIREMIGDRKLIASYQRGDPIKSVPELLDGYLTFLRADPERAKKTVLWLVATKGRQNVQTFVDYQHSIEKKVQQITKEFPEAIVFSGINEDNEAVILPLALAADVGIFGSVADGFCLAVTEFLLMKHFGRKPQNAADVFPAGALVSSLGVGATRLLQDSGLGDHFWSLDDLSDANDYAATIADALESTANREESERHMKALGEFFEKRTAEKWLEDVVLQPWHKGMYLDEMDLENLEEAVGAFTFS